MRGVFVPLALLPALGVCPLAFAAEGSPPAPDTIVEFTAALDWCGGGDDILIDPHGDGYDYVIRGEPRGLSSPQAP